MSSIAACLLIMLAVGFLVVENDASVLPELKTDALVTKDFNLQKKDPCDSPEKLGLEDGDIPDENIQASSNARNRPPSKARLNGPSFWSPASGPGAWIEVSLLQSTEVAGVITQGKAVFFVNTFKVSYKPPSSSRLVYVTESNGSIKLFDGGDPYTASTPRTHDFDPHVNAHAVRIVITAVHVMPGLRFEVIGCPIDA
ncbi:lactadherin-like [Patiria miniata]|uniref:F5/8 type C domain-containing protein n=1 Tax=Patiria miniata TaxID=46514 RepID=A0A914ATT7_PATMI|nr:lactadherin-like [Patiria miniata]